MKKKTAVFIDHESWYYGLRNLYNESTEVIGILNDFDKKYNICIKKSYGNFPDIVRNSEKEKLKECGYDLIETYEGNEKDDLTDFVMVDSIYRTLLKHPEIKHYIIFSGDAHYLQVVRTLVEMGKTVEIWAVYGTLSKVFNDYENHFVLAKKDKNLFSLLLEELYICKELGNVVNFNSFSYLVHEKYDLSLIQVEKQLTFLIEIGIIKETNYLNKRGKKKSCLVSEYREEDLLKCVVI